MQEQFPDHPSSRDALLQAASTYVRLAKYKESVARYKRFIEKYPEDEQVGRAYLNIVDVLRDQGEENDALLWSAKTQTVFHGKVVEALALFSDARLYIARNDWTSALSSLNKLSSMNDLGGAGMPGGTTVQEVSFLRGLALEQSEHFAEAVDVYLTIADGRGEYYGGRATERLRLMANDPEAKGAVDQKVLSLLSGIKSKDPEISRKNLQSIIRLTDSEEDRNQYLATLRTVYRSLPAYNRIPVLAETPLGRTKLAEDSSTQQPSIGDELFFLGLCDEAAPEFEASVISRPAPSQNVSYSLARCELQGNMANRAADFIVPLWKNVPADFQIELIPKEQLAMLYPAPFEELLLRYATSRNVDPRFELAIMRQESGFQPDIKSYAAARGLMQFISTTANTIALKLNRRPFHLEDLYDPSTSILFGSQYLADLFATFPDQPAAVAASYNGGDDNVRRWMLRSKSRSADLYIPEIAYSQSKDYAYRVMANYRIYQYLYDENLNIRH